MAGAPRGPPVTLHEVGAGGGAHEAADLSVGRRALEPPGAMSTAAIQMPSGESRR